MVRKFCEIWKFYGKPGPEEQKFCEILSQSVRYGMYAMGFLMLWNYYWSLTVHAMQRSTTIQILTLPGNWVT